MVIMHNIMAMNANRMFNLTNASQAKSTEKLSSGYKINRAADDAAGLAISEKMRRQVRGLTQARNNAQDGISCVQTAEGALNEVHDMLQRIGELAVKGANGTMTSTDRDYVTAEVRQLMKEIDRVQSTTTFNEQNLLDGTFSNKGLQVGAEAGQHINITIRDLSVNELIASALSKGIFYHTTNNSPMCDMNDSPTAPSKITLPKGEIAYWIPSGTTCAKQEYYSKGMIRPWDGTGHAHLLGAHDLTAFHSFDYNAITDENIKNRLVNGTGGAIEDLVDFSDVRYFQALNAFTKSAIADVSQVRSDLGAIQNRLEHTISNLDNVVENTESAESVIRDTDIGTEMVNYANHNILTQLGQSMLSQANQSSQGVLALLQ